MQRSCGRREARLEGSAMANFAETRRDQMFPMLSQAQLARISRFGTRGRVEAVQIVVEQGQECPNFYVVLSGALQTVQPVDGKEVFITVQQPGEFTGEVNMLSGRRSLVRIRMKDAGELLVVNPAAVRKIV